MTVNEAISRVKDRKPNAYSDESLCDWLNECEAMIQREILLTEPEEIKQYEFPEDRDTELILPKPYDSVYISYIIMMVQYTQEEYGQYNNTKSMFEAQLEAAQAYYNKLNPNPPSLKIKNWFKRW